MAAAFADGTHPGHRRTPPAAQRVLPHNLDAEASVLGGVLLRNEVLDMVETLEVDDFYDHRHKVVFQAMRALQAGLRPIDVTTVEVEIERVDRVRGTEKLAAIGGIAFLGELTTRVPTVDNVVTYASEVRLLARNRRTIISLSDALDRAYRGAHEPDELIGETIGELQRIEASGKPKYRLISIPEALDELNDLATAPTYPTPFETLNDALGFGGFLGTQVYTVASGTGRGKTSWVAAVAAHAAQTVPVLVATWEMRPGYFVARKAAGVIGTHSNEIIAGRTPAGAVLRAMPYERFLFAHKPSLEELRICVDRVAQKYGQAPLLVVDYIQKLAAWISRTMQRPDPRMATSEASEALCEIGERWRCAVVAVSAIGRGNNKRLSNPRALEPYELVDVARESGDVEYDGAGLIVLSLSKDFDGEERVATMTLAKARFGRECHIEARYNGARGSWRDLGIVWDRGEPTAVSEQSDPKLRAAIIATLLGSKNETSSKTKIFEANQKRPGMGNKPKVLTEIALMLRDGLLEQKSAASLALVRTTEPPHQISIPEKPGGFSESTAT